MFDAIQKSLARFTTTRRALMAAGALAVTLGTSGAAMAQGPAHHDRHAQMSQEERQEAFAKHHAKKMARLTKVLSLTPAQSAQVSDILESAHKERHAIKKANRGDRAAAKPQMKALRERTDAQLDAVLNPEQVALMKEHRKERRAKKKQHKQRRHAKRIDHMVTELELSPQQEAQVREVFASAKQERAQIIELVGSRREARPELKALRAKTQADVRALLNEEQAVKWDALKAQREASRKERRDAKKR